MGVIEIQAKTVSCKIYKNLLILTKENRSF